MFWLQFLIIVFALNSIESKSVRNINIMVSQSEPFAYFDAKKHSLKGLDVEIIKHFAKKYELKINYVVTNETLNEVFNSKIRVDNFLELIQNS